MKNKSIIITASVVFAISVLICLPLRMLQYFNNIEAGTGFYTEVSVDVIAFFAVIGFAFVAMLVLSLINRKNIAFDCDTKRRIPDGAVSFICALTSAYSGVAALFMKDKATQPHVYTVTATSIAAVTFLTKLAGIAALVAAVYFCLLAVSYFTGKNSGDAFKLLSLAPPVWCAARLVIRFTRTVSFIRVSDLMLEMLMLACFALFFMNFAALSSKVNGEGNEWKFITYGVTGAILGFVVSVPRIVLAVSGKTVLMYELSQLEICDLGLALFCIIRVFSAILQKASPKKSASESKISE